MIRFSKVRVRVALALLAALALVGTVYAQAQEERERPRSPAMPEPEQGYVLPPPIIKDFLDRDRSTIALNNLSPDGDHFVVTRNRDLSDLEKMSRPTYRLAGLEFRPQVRRVWTNDTAGIDRIQIFSLSERSYVDVEVPADSFFGNFTWSPDGSKVAFLAHQRDATRIFVVGVAGGRAEAVSGLAVNATIGARGGGGRGGGGGGGGIIQWTPDGKILTLVVPPDLGPEPEGSRIPSGPIIRHTRERETPIRTTQFLLETDHDADLFEHYTTSQIAELTPGGGERLIGEPGLYTSLSVSPEGDHLLTTRHTRPLSFIVSYGSFPQKTEVMDRDGNVLSTVIDRPLREAAGGGGRGGRGGSNNQPRELGWRPDGKGLTYLMREPRQGGEEGDAGDAGRADAQEEEGEENGDRKDRVMLLTAPFDIEQAEIVVDSEEPLSGHSFTPAGSRLFAGITKEGDRGLATWDLSGGEPQRTLIVDYYDADDLLEQPGNLMTRATGNGIRYALVSSDGSRAYLRGPGLKEDFRPQPFIDAVSVEDGETTRIFEGSTDTFESPGVPLDEDLSRMIVSRESPTDFPDSFLWTRGGSFENLTNNVNPYPEFADARRINFDFERRDGLKIYGRLSLPPGYLEGDKLPGVFWTYPREYDTPDEYGEAATRSRNVNRFHRTSTRNASDFWLSQGYAVIEPDIPIVGDPYNDKYVQHLVDSMYAAIRKMEEMGYVDVDRLGHGGHSYGAFATANILARSPFFKAGIAGDGAFNRSLTPMGFQSERRDIWEAPHIYIEMSPFFVADQIDTPLLMYHGVDDNNSGTWPIQSDRLIAALTGLGKTAVLYKYPYESHGPRAIEHYYDMWARWIQWFDRYVKGIGEEELTEPPQQQGRR